MTEGTGEQRQLIAIIPKNAREEIWVSLGAFKGFRLCDIRSHVADGGVPTRKGISIKPALLPQIIGALIEACAAEGLDPGVLLKTEDAA